MTTAQGGSGRLHHLASHVSIRVADAAGRPAAQIGVIILCAGWFALGFPLERLAAFFSIAALFLTQMVLSQQRRENAALHVKIDELVISMHGARDEVAGIEQKSEAEIEALRSSGDLD